MPNNKIDPSLHQALLNAFGGSQPPAVQQPSAPPPPATAGAGGGSLWQALQNAIGPTGTGVFDKAIQQKTGG